MKQYTTILFSLFLLLGFQVTSQTTAQFDNILNELFPSDGPGGTAMVVRKGETIYHKAFGMANLELDVPMHTDNIFRIGSITKQFTAAAILQLVEQGKLNLQDDITKFIEDYPTHGHTITVEHLLTHTSGIASYTGLEKWTPQVHREDFTPLEMIDFFKDEPMDFEPGEEYRYNNSAYFLLGYIIEIVSDQTYEEYIEQNIFQKLGMHNSHYGNTRQVIKNRAAGYMKNEEGYINAAFLSMTQPYGAGSLLSTVSDLSIWYHAVMNGEVISKASLQKAQTSYTLNDGSKTGYGYGWSINEIDGSPLVQHGGGIHGFLTASFFVPEEEVFVAVFSNCNCAAPQEAAIKMTGIAIGKPFDYVETTLDEALLKSYEAVYEGGKEEERIITYENGDLYSLRTGGSKFRIIPRKKDHFFFENSLTKLEFIRNSDNEIVSIDLRHQGISKPDSWLRTDQEIPTGPSIIELSAADLQKYVGAYELAPGFILNVTTEGQQIFLQATGQPRFEVFPYELHQFFATSVDIKITFEENSRAYISGLTLHQGGDHKAPRMLAEEQPDENTPDAALDDYYEMDAFGDDVRSFQQELNADYANEEKSPLNPENRAKFTAHDFFPINHKYRVAAKFTRTTDAKPFQMITSTDRLPIYQKYGELTFELDGQSYQLSVYQNHNLKNMEGYENYLFLPFNDQTNGDSSYGGGRYMDMEIQEGNTWVLDFNKSYNPYCAYSKKYSCPIPPVENFLDVEILAGIRFVN